MCFIHQKRLNEAIRRIGNLFPLNEEVYENCSSEEVAYIDQFIFRFAKLQYIIGDKLLKQVLAYVVENVTIMTFVDILNKAERFGLVTSKENWMALRKVRNDVSHDYPVLTIETTPALNLLFKLKPLLDLVLNNCHNFLINKGFSR